MILFVFISSVPVYLLFSWVFHIQFSVRNQEKILAIKLRSECLALKIGALGFSWFWVFGSSILNFFSTNIV